MEVRQRDQRTDLLSPTTSGAETGRAIVIEPWLKNSLGKRGARTSADVRTPEARLEEAVGLARAIDLTVVEAGLVTLKIDQKWTLEDTVRQDFTMKPGEMPAPGSPPAKEIVPLGRALVGELPGTWPDDVR